MPMEVLEVAIATLLDDEDLTGACTIPLWAIHQDECEWKEGAMHEGHMSGQEKSIWWLQSPTAQYLRARAPCAGRRGKAAQRQHAGKLHPDCRMFGALLRSSMHSIVTSSDVSSEESKASDSTDFVLWALLKRGGITSAASKHFAEEAVDSQMYSTVDAAEQRRKSLPAPQLIRRDLQSADHPAAGDARRDARRAELPGMGFCLGWHDIAAACISRLAHISNLCPGRDLPREQQNICEISFSKDPTSKTFLWSSWLEVQRKVGFGIEGMLVSICCLVFANFML